jgi:predicted metal-binding protein
MSIRLTICQTCKHPSQNLTVSDQPTSGTRLLEIVKGRAAADDQQIDIVGQDCLWACNRSCSIFVESANKTRYLMGDFAPDARAAKAILDWCSKVEASANGDVFFGDWHAGVKGKFIARLPATD